MKKYLIILTFIFVFFVGFATNQLFDYKTAVSDDGNWKLCMVRYAFLDEWEGFLFYKGNLSGDTGIIKTNLAEYDEYMSTEIIERNPKNYYWYALISCPIFPSTWATGIKPINTYSICSAWSEPEHIVLNIYWNEDGKEKTSQIIYNKRNNPIKVSEYERISMGPIEIDLPEECINNNQDENYREYYSYYDSDKNVKNSVVICDLGTGEIEDIVKQHKNMAGSGNLIQNNQQTVSTITIDGIECYKLDSVYRGVRFNSSIVLPVEDNVWMISLSTNSVDVKEHILNSIKIKSE